MRNEVPKTCHACRQRPTEIDGVCATCWVTLARLGDITLADAEATALRELRAQGVRGRLSGDRPAITVSAATASRP